MRAKGFADIVNWKCTLTFSPIGIETAGLREVYKRRKFYFVFRWSQSPEITLQR